MLENVYNSTRVIPLPISRDYVCAILRIYNLKKKDNVKVIEMTDDVIVLSTPIDGELLVEMISGASELRGKTVIFK